MNNIQSMLTMGAMILLALTSLRFNASVLQTSSTEVENKVYLTAFSLADDMIEEIKNKNFDQTTVPFPTNNPGTLTPAGSLGPESGETYATFNDIDDYNNFTKIISAPHAEDYQISCKVFYVDGSNPDNQISTQSFYKKAEVTVSSPFLTRTVKLSFIFTLK
jgi:hypothetical protein